MAVTAGAALLAGAALVAWSAPSDDDIQSPIATTAKVGETATGRTLRATVQKVEVARVVHGGGWTGTTSGVWLVVRLRAEALLRTTGVSATLTVGDRSWSASERPPTSLSDALLDAGLPAEGDLLFELPRSALAGRGTLQVTASSGARLDSAIRVPLDLAFYRDRLDHIWGTLGSDRLMFGSDWPVCLAGSSYKLWHDTVSSFANLISESEKAALFGGTSQKA